MFVVLLPLLLIAAWRMYDNQTPGVMTPERKAVYAFNVREERDPAKLKFWGDFFAKEGFDKEAQALYARAKLPTINGEGRSRRAQIVRRAFASNNPSAIFGVADEFECRGYGETAHMLRDYANGLRWAMVVPDCDPCPPVAMHTQTSTFGNGEPNANS